MDVREKLVELLRNAKAAMKAENLSCDLAKNMFIVDFMMANGVTVQDNMEISDELLERLRKAPVTVMTEEPTVEPVQEWISVKDRLPEEEEWYLVYTTPSKGHKSINKAMFCKGYAWSNFDPYWRGAGGHWANVTHWMPLPQPPKGE